MIYFYKYLGICACMFFHYHAMAQAWGDVAVEPIILSRIKDQVSFENYTSRDGLTQNSCFAIEQDGDGFMWFGTQDGLNRFDGHEFKVYGPGKEGGNGLASNHIWSLQYLGNADELWIGTDDGLCIYRPAVDSIYPIGEVYGFARQLNAIPIKKIYCSSPGQIWVVTTSAGLLKIDLPAQRVYSFFGNGGNTSQVMDVAHMGNKIIAGTKDKLYVAESASGNPIFKPMDLPDFTSPINVLHAAHNTVWIGTLSTGVYSLEFDGPHVLRPFPFDVGGVDCFATEGDDYLWMGSRGKGIFRYNLRTQAVQSVRYNRYDPHSPGADFVLDLYLDDQNIMWCGLSGGGVSKYDPLRFQFFNLTHDPLGSVSLPENMVYSIHLDADDQYYAGGQNKGLFKWDPRTMEVDHYLISSQEGAPENKIFDITEGPGGTKWLASWGGLYQFNPKSQSFVKLSREDFPQSRSLLQVHQFRQNHKLLVSGDHGLAMYDPHTGEWSTKELEFPDHFTVIARHIYEDEKGILWISTERRGLVRLDLAGKTVESVREVLDISKNARHLYPDGDVLWVATDQGVVVYHKLEKKIIHHITLEHLGPSNVVYTVQKGTDGHFWIGTNLGLVKIHPEDLSMQLYNLENGLDFLEFNTACAVTTPDGTMAFGGVGGITIFHPDYITTNPYSPTPIITSVSVWDTHDARWKKGKQRFRHDENILTFGYTNNNFSNQRRDRYQYRLLGLDTNWHDNANNYTATYNNLPSDNYIFQVKSANCDGIWADHPAEFAFVIIPPWWKRGWFWMVVALSTLGLATFFIKMRIRNIRQKAELNNRITETKMMALRAQMNPHFIFNCLNSIDAFIQSNDKYQATTYLNKFARLLRNVLDASKQNTVKFSKDIETLKLYIELEELRNDHKFSTHFHIDEILLNDDFRVPPLLIQPYVENAIIHGLRHLQGQAGRLNIVARKLQEYIHFTIEDNGVGRNAIHLQTMKNKNSYGMQMSSERIRYFNEEEFPQVRITDLTDQGTPAGTRVEVYLKLK